MGEPRNADEAYAVFEPVVPLHGESYDPHRMALFYAIAGHMLHRHVIKDGAYMWLDTRMPQLFVLPPEHGKDAMVHTIKRSMELVGLRAQAPTSYHEEALVGRVDRERNGPEWDYIQVPGVFAADWVIMDDALPLMTDPEYEPSRHYALRALNQYGRNRIEKPQAGVPPDQQLDYLAECTITAFFQPHEMNETLVGTGYVRRHTIIASGISGEEREAAMRLKGPPGGDPDMEPWAAFLRSMVDFAGLGAPWRLVDGTMDEATDQALSLIQGAVERSVVTQGYLEVNRFTTRNLLLRGAAVRAAAEQSPDITPVHVADAARDLGPILRGGFGYIGKNMPSYGQLPPAVWSAARYARAGYTFDEWMDLVTSAEDGQVDHGLLRKAFNAFEYCGAVETSPAGRITKARPIY